MKSAVPVVTRTVTGSPMPTPAAVAVEVSTSSPPASSPASEPDVKVRFTISPKVAGTTPTTAAPCPPTSAGTSFTGDTAATPGTAATVVVT